MIKMKHVFTLGFLLMLSFASQAQDTIITRNGKIQLATITMVDRTNVQYQDYPQSNGYTYIMDIDKIKELRYHDGRHIDFMPKEITKNKPLATSMTVIPPYKNPAAAFAFSTIPGLGQFYNDEVGKGLWFMGIGLISSIAFNVSYAKIANSSNLKKSSSSEGNAGAIMLLSGLTLVVDYIWGTVDAVKTANKKNKQNGYVVSLAPSMQYNTLAASNGNLGITPSLSMSISF